MAPSRHSLADGEKRVLAIALVLASTAVARAQPGVIELGRLEVAVSAPLRPSDFVVLVRHAPPAPALTEVPPDAVDLLTRWSAAAASLRAAVVTRRAAATDAERSTADARIALLDGRAARAHADLEAALADEEATLSRPALLLLGMLRWDDAAEARLDALDAWEACSAGGGACPDPEPIEDAAALATWARITGDDALAAWALYERGTSLAERDEAEADRLWSRMASLEATPSELLGEAAYRMAEHRDPTDARGAATEYARCARLASPSLAPHCAFRAAAAYARSGRTDDALTTLVPVLDAPEVPEARLLAGELAARTSPPVSLPIATRVRLLVEGADRLASYGLFGAARDRIAVARTLSDDPALVSLEQRYETLASTPLDLQPWLVRQIAFCAAADTASAMLAFSIRARVTPHGTFVTRVSPAQPPAGRELARCLGRAVPAPGLDATFHADVVLTAS